MQRPKRIVAGLLAMLIAIVASVGLVSSANAINAGGQNLQFTNTVKIGQDAVVGFSTRYPGVFAGVDALVTVKEISPSTPTLVTKISNIDRVSTVNNWQLWTNLQIASGGGYVTYSVEFVTAGSRTPVTLENFSVNVGDIDAQQYVQFTGPSAYTLASNTQLQVAQKAQNPAIPTGAYRFIGPVAGSTDDDTRFWAQVNYAKASGVDVTLGAGIGGAALYQVSFGAASWGSTPVVTPPPPSVLPQLTVSYNANTGTGTAPVPSTQNVGTEHTINANTFTPPSSTTFLQWNTKPDGSGVAYQASDKITPTVDTVLYAIWDQTVNLRYLANGGTGTSPGDQLNTSTSVITTIKGNTGPYSRDGYEFVGWNTRADGSGVTFLPGATLNLTANTDLHAMWRLIPVVPPDSPIHIDVEPGQPTGGGEVDYVIENQPGSPNCNPEVPGQAWSLDVTSLESGSSYEIDAGCTPAGGDIYGTAVLPQDVPEGIYEVVYESSTGEQIILYFEVGPNGTFEGQTNTDPRLAKTGNPASGFILPIGAGVLALLGGAVAVTAARRRRQE